VRSDAIGDGTVALDDCAGGAAAISVGRAGDEAPDCAGAIATRLSNPPHAASSSTGH